MKKNSAKTILLIANGDLRQSANEATWQCQVAMEKLLTAAVAKLGYKLVRAHPYKSKLKHGFIGSQKEGMAVFAKIDPKTPIIVAEAVWQYSHHILHGLISHEAPILTVANWSGSAPGLVGMLNLNGSLTKAGVKYSTLWSKDFTDDFFLIALAGQEPKLPKDWDELFGMNSKPLGDPQKYPSRSELVAALDERRAVMEQWLSALSDAELLKPIEGDLAQFAANRAQLGSSCSFHDAFHAAQISATRRVSGLPHLF